MSSKAVNIFLLATEHHFLVALSIIEKYFPGDGYINKLFFLGHRLSQVDKKSLPSDIIATDLFLSDDNFVERVDKEIFSTSVDNLFVVNAYRAEESYILSRTPKTTKRHLIQDGALFYNRIERSVFVNHLKNVLHVYRDLWRKKIWFTDFLYYGRFMETSNYIDELWMTHPNYYIGPKTKKPIHHVTLFPCANSISDYTKYFLLPVKEIEALHNCLLYLPVYIKDPSKIPLEIECIQKILEALKLDKVFIKLHPNASSAQFQALKKAFGTMVFRNNIAAEIYIANARQSYIIGCNSTSLFYNNPSCRFFALKKFYQDLGIFSIWYNINMPSHVAIVDNIDEIHINQNT